MSDPHQAINLSPLPVHPPLVIPNTAPPDIIATSMSLPRRFGGTPFEKEEGEGEFDYSGFAKNLSERDFSLHGGKTPWIAITRSAVLVGMTR